MAHQEIDLKNAKSNIGNSGFTDEEREKMTRLLSTGFVDTFVSFILKKKEPILGGRIWLKYENGILAGVLTILLYLNALETL